MVNFVDQELPFSQYLPQDSKLHKTIYIILGSDFAWKHLLTALSECEPKKILRRSAKEAVQFELGSFWLRFKIRTLNTIDTVVAVLQLAILLKQTAIFEKKLNSDRTTSYGQTSMVRVSYSERVQELKCLINLIIKLKFKRTTPVCR